MKKVLKNIFKWLALVFISFSVIFTLGITSGFGWGIIESITYKVENLDQPILYNLESSNLKELCKSYQEYADRAFSENINLNNYATEEDMIKALEFKELYKDYPVGLVTVANQLTLIDGISNAMISSLLMAIVFGTAIYLLIDKEKKGLKTVILIYILSIIVLGFMEGFLYVSGDNLTLFDRWMFPEESIIPVSIAFALVLVVRYVRQKDIADKLNEKLKQIKEEKNK